MDSKKLFVEDPDSKGWPSDQGFEIQRGTVSVPDDVVVCKLLVTQELYFVLPDQWNRCEP